jgi:hypothetical protein
MVLVIAASLCTTGMAARPGETGCFSWKYRNFIRKLGENTT